MGATDGVGARFRKTEVLDLAFSDQTLHCAGDLFDRHVGINPMLIQKVDRIDAESTQGSFGRRPDQLRTTRNGRVSIGVAEPKLGGDDHSVAHGGEALADEYFVGERPIHLRCVEERHTEINGRAEQ
jgi:hypothetical protein